MIPISEYLEFETRITNMKKDENFEWDVKPNLYRFVDEIQFINNSILLVIS